MRTHRIYHHSFQSTRRFSGVLRSWFPAIHQRTFYGTTGAGIIRSAVRRTADHV